MTEVVQSVSLYSDANGSDKTYDVQIIKVDEGFLVNYQNGPRLGRKTSGTKTKSPVTYESALKTFNSVMREKINGSSRYRVVHAHSTDATPLASISTVPAREPSGFQPMMLNEVRDPDHLEALLNDPNVVAEEKFDGEFLTVLSTTSGIAGSNKKGFVTTVPRGVADAFAKHGHLVSVDGEQVGEHFYAFELPQIHGQPSFSTYWERRLALGDFVKESEFVHIVRMSGTDRTSKLAKIEEVRARGGEGVVFKHLDAPYSPGISMSLFRHKFAESATVIVVEHNDKRSVVVGAMDAEKTLRKMCSVTIPANADIPQVNSIVEVKYLYAYPGTHALAQPVYKGVRHDQDASDCVLSKLKYKVELDHDAVSASNGCEAIVAGIAEQEEVATPKRRWFR